jgi:hypothetical protein
MTLLEVMIAGAVLSLGLVGVMQLLILGAKNERRGEQSLSQALLVSEAMEGSMALAYGNLTPGTTTTLLKDRSGRDYTQIISVTASPPAVPNAFYTVKVQITRPGGAAGAATYENVTVVSQPPAGGGAL